MFPLSSGFRWQQCSLLMCGSILDLLDLTLKLKHNTAYVSSLNHLLQVAVVVSPFEYVVQVYILPT